MDNEAIQKLKMIFEKIFEVKLVYFFGSRARGDDGPLSDYDFAFYFDESDSVKLFDLKLKLMDEISRLLKTDKVDVVILNITENPELKYQIIKEGKLIYEQEPFKVVIEPKILNEYFDFRYFLLKYNLTKA